MPPVAMSAYHLKQVAREWNLGLIYRGADDAIALVGARAVAPMAA